MSEQEQFVTIKEVAAHYSVSISTIRAWIRNNVIPKESFIKLGTTYRFKISAVTEALLDGAEPKSQNQLEMDFGEPQKSAPIKLYDSQTGE